jgi:GMP synthase-like glutamine amidotransferase
MRIHCLLPTPHESAGHIATWAGQRGHSLTRSVVSHHEPLPDISEIDWLVVTHGPASTQDPNFQTWLDHEKRLVAKAVDRGLPVLGLGLGADMLSDVLGGQERPQLGVKFGWHPVTLSPQGRRCEFFADFPETFQAFHWHDDTLSIPPQACRMAGSESCFNEAFVHGDCVVGLQFHLEYTPAHVGGLAQPTGWALPSGPLAQTANEILADPSRFAAAQGLMERLLGVMESKVYGRWSSRPQQVHVEAQPPTIATTTSLSTRVVAPGRRAAVSLQ